MRDDQLVRDDQPIEYRRVPLWRRGCALLIDFVAVGFVSLLVSSGAVAIVFIFVLGWLGMRVALVDRNHGQSLGRWALDMRVLDLERGGTPDLVTLAKREGGLGLALGLFLVGFLSLGTGGLWAILLVAPIAIDLIPAWLNPENQQALHDQLTDTHIAESRRGYSIDIKLRKWIVEARARMK
ncbi:RDD family protein [Microcoleus sp. FACHB-1515]|uniref:RDD family protein n=1 Tax=Cyanophyceae TaxID=3028117 RepID=UPI0016848A88|nr:RDD family protein [Microcoleus sp. FACHB-1515]MBD2091053.1 RDD family protein [Microcoleus sp. FACHB-1515]